MAKIQPVWALDIGQAALKALKLVPGAEADQVVAEAFDFVEYPKILSQPDADPEVLVREALQTFLERNDLKGCKVALGVPGQAGLVKFIKLPPVEKKRVPDIVKFEARQQIPFALEEVIWDYQQIGGDDEDEGFAMAEVGLFAMKRDQINRAILPLTAARIEVDVVQMGPIALFNFAAFDLIKPEDKDKGSVVLLDIGADNTDLIVTDGSRIWQRNVPIGGNHFTRALTKELKLTFAKAEHLKRNATKAPDPRAVFTAMRGIFNDFSSEVNRSIGFYSSVNRTAKIARIVGLGNGFKLPGLQKFLQQNLSYEVEKLEGFAHLTGDEVKGAPQFQENLPSFAVAYGLGLQGLGISKLRTNLIPPEIERVRMVRRKKPWALAASALVVVGISAMLVSDLMASAKVNSAELKSAAAEADSTTKQAGSLKSGFEAAKTEWQTQLDQGNALIPDLSGPMDMAAFLKRLNEALPDVSVSPIDGHKLNPDDPKDREIMDKLRVHVDAIKPVWSGDLAKWYTELPETAKNVMHPYDRKNAPEGEGWIIQFFGHHYNPRPETPEARKLGIDMGPVAYLTKKILPQLGRATYRQFGFRNATITWILPDPKWTGEKSNSSTALPAGVPLTARNTTPTVEGGDASGAGGMGDMMAMMKGMYGGKGAGGGMGGPGGGGMDPSAMMKMMMGSGMYGGQMGGPAAAPKDLKTRTRTDFKIEFVWKPEEKPKELAEIEKDVREAEQAAKGATEIPSDVALTEASRKATEKAIEAAVTGAPATTPTAPVAVPVSPAGPIAAPAPRPVAPKPK